MAYSLALYYLGLIRSGIYWIKSRNSSANFVYVFRFYDYFSLSIKSLIISNFLKIKKAIVSNWYQNSDDKLIRKDFHLDKLKEYYRENKEKIKKKWKELMKETSKIPG